MKIGLVAPSYALRLGLRTLIEDFPAGGTEGEARIEIVLEASSIEQLAGFLEQVEVLMVAGETTSMAALRQSAPGGLSLLLLTEDLQVAGQLRRLGLRAWGVLPPDSRAHEIYAALLAVHQGLVVGSPDLLVRGLEHLQIADEELDGALQQLTERERQVLQLLARGLPNKRIALELSISEHTVKFHVSAIYTKLGAASRTEAVRLGLQQGLVVL